MSNGLYVHIPFCRKKCSYCAFVVAVSKTHWVDDYLRALSLEIERCAPERVDTLYIGGGSPSFLTGDQIKRLFDLLSGRFDLSALSEVSFEMNPEDVSRPQLAALRSCGVNRISLGVQSFCDERLSFLGRCHDGARALEAYDLLRSAGFSNVNMDLMYGFPDQSAEELSEDLTTVLGLKPEHISLYTLTLESPSKFSVFPPDLPSPENLAGLFKFIKAELETSGYSHYEVSNFSRPGFESKHNLNYWQAGDYLGLGVGAHSHCAGRRWWNVDQTPRYIQCVINGGSPCAGEETLSAHQRLREALVFGLRMTNGVSLTELEKRFGVLLDGDTSDRIEQYVRYGLMELSKDTHQLKMTLEGMLVLDEVSARLV